MLIHLHLKMASPSSSSCIRANLMITLGICLLLCGSFSNAQLSSSVYDKTCPQVFDITWKVIADAWKTDPRILASLTRLHFHDCFVHGCDASVLLDNSTDRGHEFTSEKYAGPNKNSIRGFGVVDKMKAALEEACPQTVSCADILAIAALQSVQMSGGPWWEVLLGRKDSVWAYYALANEYLPSSYNTLDELKVNFAAVGLNLSSDLVALSGAHTFGRTHCHVIQQRLYDFNHTGKPDPTLNTTYLTQLQKLCPEVGNSSTLVNLDAVTPNFFDKQYYSNLRVEMGTLRSDQELFSTSEAEIKHLVESYSENESAFFEAFGISMIRMGNIAPPPVAKGEIRMNCSLVNPSNKGENNNVSVSAI